MAAPPVRYRADIDGLRAVAILSILLLHCGVSVLRGGFIGVDIFFVISGYLITGILTRNIAAGRFSLIEFYRHRIVRILPALVAMLIIVAIAGCVLLLPNQIRELGKSMVAASLFASNFYFFATSDYFDNASDTLPLIHSWSLAVEEQFYLLYPLLLMSLRHLSRGRLAVVIACLAAASLAIGALLALHYPSAAFFLLPARMWELSLGALIALRAVPAINSPRLRAALCLAALAVIAASCGVIGSTWSFPVPFAIPPAVATAILIAYGETGPTARLLSLPPLRAIGFISYSLYLWHRPIIAFYENAGGESFSKAAIVGLITASFAAATASYLFVERPAIRRWRTGTGFRPHAAALALLAGVAAIGLFLTANADAIRPLSPALAKIASYLRHDRTAAGRAQFSIDRCFTIPTGEPFDADCLRLAADRRNVLLMGDSHGAHLSQALREQLPGVNLLQATAAGCRPLLHPKGLARCRSVMDRALRGVDLGRIDTAILSGRWFDFDQAPLLETIRFLQTRGVKVVVIGPSIEYDADLPTLIVHGRLAGDLDLPARLRLTDRIPLDRQMGPRIRRTGASYFSEVGFECPDAKCRLLTKDGAPIYFDHSHLTPSAARELVTALLATHPLNAPVGPSARH